MKMQKSENMTLNEKTNLKSLLSGFCYEKCTSKGFY